MASRKELYTELDETRQKLRNITDLIELLGRGGMSANQYEQWRTEQLTAEARIAELKLTLWSARNIEGDEI